MNNVLQFLLWGAIVGALLAGFIVGRLSKSVEVVEVNGPYEELYIDLLDKHKLNNIDYRILLDKYKKVYEKSIIDENFIEEVFVHMLEVGEVIEFAENEAQVHNILLAFYTAMLDEKARYEVDKP